MSNNDIYELICEVAASLGKKRQDIANWTFSGFVPKKHRFDIYLLAKIKGVELTQKEFENFKK